MKRIHTRMNSIGTLSVKSVIHISWKYTKCSVSRDSNRLSNTVNRYSLSRWVKARYDIFDVTDTLYWFISNENCKEWCIIIYEVDRKLFSDPIGEEWNSNLKCIPVNPPPFCGSLPRKSLISRMDWVSCAGDINLPHDLPPTKKSSTIKSWPTFCDQYFWKFPIWNSCADEKRWEIRMVKVFKWYPVIDLFDTFTVYR